MGFPHSSQCLIFLSALLVLVAVLCPCGLGEARTIVVGGPEHWRSGFNYSNWALNYSPFFINDTLVFKYDLPSENNTGYNVYLLPNLLSYLRCDFKKAKLLANSSQGSDEGFSYLLNRWRPQYFASGEDGGSQCNAGMMKFSVVPLSPWTS